VKGREEKEREEGREDIPKYISPPLPSSLHSHDVKLEEEIVTVFSFVPMCLIPPPIEEEEEEMFSKREEETVEEGNEEEEKK
jgi:hypothetical protein